LWKYKLNKVCNRDVWKKIESKDTDKKDIRLYNKSKREIHTKKRKSLSFVQRKEKKSKEIYKKNKEGVYLAIKITPDCICIFYKKEEWEKENSIRLLISQ